MSDEMKFWLGPSGFYSGTSLETAKLIESEPLKVGPAKYLIFDADTGEWREVE